MIRCAQIDDIRRGGYGQDIFTLRSTYLQGRPPKSVNMYWRRFAVSSIPVDDPKAFELWLKQVWLEKEDLLEYYAQNGRFPADDGLSPPRESDGSMEVKGVRGAGFIETEVRMKHWYEIGQIFVAMAAFGLVANILAKVWNIALHGRM